MGKQSEALFQRAQEIIPGGVNSPVRAFRGVGGTRGAPLAKKLGIKLGSTLLLDGGPQTLMSTNPSGSASPRITSSVMSVGTFEDFFGQETHTTASSAVDDVCSGLKLVIRRELRGR
jgi:hypothetical protein